MFESLFSKRKSKDHQEDSSDDFQQKDSLAILPDKLRAFLISGKETDPDKIANVARLQALAQELFNKSTLDKNFDIQKYEVSQNIELVIHGKRQPFQLHLDFGQLGPILSLTDANHIVVGSVIIDTSVDTDTMNAELEFRTNITNEKTYGGQGLAAGLHSGGEEVAEGLAKIFREKYQLSTTAVITDAATRTGWSSKIAEVFDYQPAGTRTIDGKECPIYEKKF